MRKILENDSNRRACCFFLLWTPYPHKYIISGLRLLNALKVATKEVFFS